MLNRLLKLLTWFTLIDILYFGVVVGINAADEWDPQAVGTLRLGELGPATAIALWIARNSLLVLFAILVVNLGLLFALWQAVVRRMANRRQVLVCAACVLAAALVHVAAMTFVTLGGSIHTAQSVYVFSSDQFAPMFIPDLLVSLPAILALAAVVAFRRPEVQPDICQHCGYDLRASPERCPECGAVRRV